LGLAPPILSPPYRSRSLSNDSSRSLTDDLRQHGGAFLPPPFQLHPIAQRQLPNSFRDRQQRCVREERFFDVGYEMGWEAGIAQFAAFARGRNASVARRQVHRVLVSSDLSRTERAPVLLKVTLKGNYVWFKVGVSF
jgi:hypothetical protein